MPLRITVSVLLVTLVAAAIADGRSDLRPGFERAACSPGAFPIDSLRSPTGAQRGDEPSSRALRRIIRDPSSEPYIEGRVPKHRWRLLRTTERFVIYGAGDASRISPLSLRLTKRGKWSYVNLDSGCRPRVLRSDLASSSWKLDNCAAPVADNHIPAAACLGAKLQQRPAARGGTHSRAGHQLRGEGDHPHLFHRAAEGRPALSQRTADSARRSARRAAR